MHNFKKLTLIALIVVLIFILSPISFAGTTDCNDTADILSGGDEYCFIVENTNYVIDDGDDVEITGTIHLFDEVDYPDELNIKYEYDDASGLHQSDIVHYHEDYSYEPFSFVIKNLTYKGSPYIVTISAVEDELYEDYLMYGNPLEPINVYIEVVSPFDPEPGIPVYETFTPKGQLYVSAQDGNDSFDGSKDSPFQTIQKALDQNQALGGNYEIIVMRGNYTFEEYYTIRNNVSIKGQGKVKISNIGSYYIFFLYGQITVELKNLIMSDGLSGVISGAATVNGLGEPINENKVLNIINCTFQNNIGGLSNDHPAVGVIKSYSKTTILNSTFINNRAYGSQEGFKGLINLPDGTLTINYCSFIDNTVLDGTPLIYTAKRSDANFNFWGRNEGPNDSEISENVKVKTWIAYSIETYNDEKLMDDEYSLNVTAKYTNSTGILKNLSYAVPDLELVLKAKTGDFSKSNIIVSNNNASIIYYANKIGEEQITLYLGDTQLYSIKFNVNPPISDRIYVSPTGNDSSFGTYKNPLATIKVALDKNSQMGGDKTIYILTGTYFENNLQITDKVTIIAYNATINGQNNKILIITNDTKITGLKLINGDAIIHNNGNLEIINSTFENNGIAIASENNLKIYNSTFIGNDKAVSAIASNITLCNFENNNISISILNANISDSQFTKNKLAINIIQFACIEGNNFTLNENSINITDSTHVLIINNAFNSDKSPIKSFNSKLSLFNNKFSENTDYALDLNSSVADVKNNTISGINAINLVNSSITNAILTFIENKTIKAKNGTIQINATVTDDMGNPVNGGKIYFGTTPGEVVNGLSYIFRQFNDGDYIITGDSDNFPNATTKNGLLRINVKNYWFINDVGYETLAEAIDDADVDDVIKGIPGEYAYDTIQIGHRTRPSEPWVINKQITITSLTDKPITLKALGKNVFNIDYYSNVTVKNIIFMNAYNPNGWGGAIHSMGKNTVKIDNCTFMDNYAEDGAAIHSYGNLYINNTLFINNEARVYGGAVYKDGDGNFIIENSKFLNNSAYTYAGAVYTMGYSEIYQIFRNITFDGNNATCGGALFTSGKNVTFIDCNFTNNKAVDKQSGYEPLAGAVYVHNGATRFVNVKFINNTAEGNGGALELDNGVTSILDGSGRHVTIRWAVLENCTIENNVAAGFGGAIYTDEYNTYVNITNTVIKNNTARNVVVLVNFFGFYTLNNVTVEDNKNTQGNLLTYSYGMYSYPESFYSNITISNSLFKNNGENTVVYAENEYVTVNITNSTFKGNGQILDLNYANATLTDNIESDSLANISINNKGNLSLSNNTFANPINSTGVIKTPAFIMVLGNQTLFETVGNMTIEAAVVDDNNNIIIGHDLEFIVADSQTIPAIFENNKFKANYTVKILNQTISATYSDTGLINLKTRVGIIIGRVIPQISADNVEFNITGEFKVLLTYNGEAIDNENITLVINNENYYSLTDSNGIATFNLELPHGEYITQFRFNGNYLYSPASDNASITVNKYASKIRLEVKDTEIYEDAIIKIYLPENATGNIVIDVNGKEYYTTAKDGIASITIPNLKIGQYSVYVDYHGDDKFLNSSAKGEFRVIKKEAVLNVTYNDNELNIILPEDANGLITVKTSDNEYNMTLVNGKVSLNITGVSQIIIAYSGDDKYAPFNLIRTIVEKQNTSIKIISKISGCVVDVRAGEPGEYIYIMLVDAKGNALANKNIKFKLNSKTYNVKTDKNGKAKLQVNLKTAGSYTLKVLFNGDDQYNSCQSSVKLKMKSKKITIKAKAKKFKASKKIKKYKITLKTTKNKINGKKYLKKGKTVILKIKGKKFKAKTNAKGQATFKIKKLNKKGKYKAKIIFKGDGTYKSASKKVKITIK